MNNKRFLCLLLALIFVVACLSGCRDKKNEADTNEASAVADNEKETDANDSSENEAQTKPIGDEEKKDESPSPEGLKVDEGNNTMVVAPEGDELDGDDLLP